MSLLYIDVHISSLSYGMIYLYCQENEHHDPMYILYPVVISNTPFVHPRATSTKI